MTRILQVLLGVAAMAVGAAGPALAQYPGTTSTTAAPSVTVQSAGTLAVGQETTVTSCGFRPGPVNLSVNGQGGATDTAEADGCARSTLAVLGVSLVRVEGVQFAAGCGTNTLAVSGTAPSGGARTVNTSFSIDCPAAAGAGLLPRTGATVVRWSLSGAALLGVGALAVLAARRRRREA